MTEIMVNGTEHVFYEKGGRLYRSERRFISEERLNDVIQQIAGEANRYVNEASPIADARLPDGSRVNIVLKPVAVNGPILTIRKFPSEAITMDQLVRMGSLTRGSGGIHPEAGSRQIQYLRKRRDGSREDHLSECHVGLYPEGRADHNDRG